MNLLTVLLQAPAAGPDGSLMWIMLIAMFVIMYFFMIRPQNKKQKEIANFRKSLQVNQNVITAGGIHRKDQKPFNTSGDFSYRVIPFDTPSDMLMVTHGDFDNSDINKDVNAMFPIDRLHELVEEGFIGYF